MNTLRDIEPLRNLVEMFQARCHETPDNVALKHKVNGTWKSITYREWLKTVEILATVLSLDCQKDDFVSIISTNRPEWTYVDLATMMIGAVVAPLYPTSVPRDISYIVNDCSAKMIFCENRELLDKILSLKKAGEIPSIRKIVVFDDEACDESDVVTFKDYLKQGRVSDRSAGQEKVRNIDPQSVMTLIYTSGTTGNPKGVMLTHDNIMSNIKAAMRKIGEQYFHEGTVLSFLPLSHSLERSCGYYLAIMAGMTIAYAESIPKLLQNFSEIKPTILVSVPRIYEKIYAAILENATTPLKRKIVTWAMQIGREKAFHDVERKPVDFLFPLKYSLAYKLVFSKLHTRLGGNFRFAACGGAPLSKEIAIFLQGAGILVVEGYGQTETSPILTLNGPDEMRFGSVGKPVPGVELKLEPDPEGMQGDEILARGPNIMKGYYHREEETSMTVTPDGWIHTGDIGYIDEDGFLFITDRKKELLKTSGGKFVAPAPIENSFRLHPLVEQACVIGNSRKFCSVLIFPNRERLARDLGEEPPASAEELAADPRIHALFQGVIDEINRELNTWERIKKFAFLPYELSQETGEMTPTMKMKRRIIDEKFGDVIDSLYIN